MPMVFLIPATINANGAGSGGWRHSVGRFIVCHHDGKRMANLQHEMQVRNFWRLWFIHVEAFTEG